MGFYVRKITDFILQDRVVQCTSISIIILFLAPYFLTPILFDTRHVSDTLLLGSLGFRVYNGYHPVADFQHFYGGLTAYYVALTMHLFGTHIKVLDYALVLQFISAAALAKVVTINRASSRVSWALILLIALCILNRTPLEENYRQVYTHSYTYNHMGLAIIVSLMIYSLLPSDSKKTEYIVSFLCGVSAFVLSLLKPTFVVFLPAVFLALVLQSRFYSAATFFIGLLACFIFIDPFATKLISSFSYAVEMTNDRVGISGLLSKFSKLMLGQAFQISLVLVSFWLAHRNISKITRCNLLAIAGLFIAGNTVVVTMGELGQISRQLAPLVIVLSLVALEYSEELGQKIELFVKFVSIVIFSAFIIPQLYFGAVMVSHSLNFENDPKIKSGPLKNYIAIDPKASPVTIHSLESLQNISEKIAIDQENYLTGSRFNTNLDYLSLVEGINILKKIDGIQNFGIISTSAISFEYALRSQPVLDYPLWPTTSSPEVLSKRLFNENVDIVMFGKYHDQVTRENIIRKMGENYSLCNETTFWKIYSRKSSAVQNCNYKENSQGKLVENDF